MCSPLADYSELDLILLGRGKVMDLRPSHSACPFCNRPFKSPGAFANPLEKIHSGQLLPNKQKRAISSNNQSSETTSLGENISGGNFCDALCSQFADYSELTDLIPPGRDKDERREEMPHGDDSLLVVQVNDSSEANALSEDTIHFPVDREAGNVVATYPFQKTRDPRCNFLRPFENPMDYELASFFCSPRVPRTHVDESFRNGFLSAGLDASHMTFSYHSVYTMHQKINEMVMDPQWKFGFADFKLDKTTEFWYRDIMSILNYLLRRKLFASHMVWAPIHHFDCYGERVYTEMHSGTWWWDTQVLPSKSHDLLPLTGYSRWSFQLAQHWSPSSLRPIPPI